MLAGRSSSYPSRICISRLMFLTLSLRHTEEEILLRPGPGFAVLVCEGEPWRIGAVSTAAVQQCPLEDADGTGRHRQLRAMLGSGAYLAARHRFAYRLDPLRRPLVAAAVDH